MATSAATVFVLLPKGPDAEARYRDAIRPACEAAALRCRRADDLPYGGQLPQEIHAELEKADFVVADLTGRSPNIFYELGYAHALRRPTILLAATDSDAPFDLTSQRIIVFGGDLQRLRAELTNSLIMVRSTSALPEPAATPAGVQLPTVLSIVVADIVGSTTMLRELGTSDAAAAIQGFTSRARDAFIEHQGVDFRSVGDGFFATFATTDNAFAFALTVRTIGSDVQRPTTRPIRLRLAIHRGSITARRTRHGPDVFGEAINLAVRLVNAAKPDQIFLSRAAVADLSPDRLALPTWTTTVELKHGDTVEATVVAPSG